MPEIIIDENLRLVSPTLENAEELHDAVCRSLPHLKPWLLWATDDYSLENVRVFINDVQQKIADKTALEYSIFYQGKIAGGIGFISLSAEYKNAEIGYWIAAEYEGKGLITRSFAAVVEHAFLNLGLDEVYLRIAGSNRRSRAAAERQGFTVTLVNPGAHQLPGRMDDLIIYSLRKSDRFTAAKQTN